MSLQSNMQLLNCKVATVAKRNKELREATIHEDWAKLTRVIDRRLSEAGGEVEAGDDGERDTVNSPEP